jgi:acyl transferase domain-containing protein
VLGGSYWRRQVTEPTRLDKSLATLEKHGCDWLLEIGPVSSFAGAAAAQWSMAPPRMLASLAKGDDESAHLLDVLGRLYVDGYLPDFAAVDQPWPRRKLPLPPSPLERHRYWITDVARHVAAK